jgi:glycoside/pentoside/hexuronide:cation symporter, GPH family
MAAAPVQEPPLRRGMLLAFVLPAIMLGFMHTPEPLVQGIYAKYSGLSLTALAGAMLLTRMFDAFTYPLIGHWSDASFRRSGSRKPWMLAGTVVSVTGLWFLYRPPAGVSIGYFTLWMAVTYVGWKLTEIPYNAWALTLTRDYVQRTRVQLWRAMALMFGSLVFYIVPYGARQLGLTADTELNLKSLGFTALVLVVCVPLLNFYSLVRVPNGEAPPPAPPVRRAGVGEMLRALAGNTPLQRLMAALVPTIFLTGMATGVIYLYADSYMHLGKELPLILLVSTPFTLLGLPFWGWMCLKFERHRVWAAASLLAALGYAGMGLAPIGQNGLYPIMVLYTLSVFCQISIAVSAPAMMGDVIDYERWRNGEDRAGIYSAILLLATKSMTGVSGALGLAVVGWFGFEAAAGQQTWIGEFGIKLVAVWLPALGLALSAPLAWWFPITRARQAEIREAIRLRDAQTAVAPPLKVEKPVSGTIEA